MKTVTLKKHVFKNLLVLTLLALSLFTSHAAVVYDQPGGGAGWQSSWWTPNGSDYDQYTWDNFSISSNVPITEIKWRGGYYYGGTPVASFTISIYSSIAGNSQPNIATAPALATYTINGNASQTPAGAAAGVSYDYDYVLPTPFQVTAGTVYWIQIEAAQAGIPDWAIGAGSGGDARVFRQYAYVGEKYYSYAPGDAAFTLLTADTAIYSVAASANPVASGTIAGAGLFPTGMTASLVATPATNFAFVNWMENGAVIGSLPNLSGFVVTSNRTLVANFAVGSAISTTVFPTGGGSATGAGSYTNGASVTVTATTNTNYKFVNWTENGAQVSTSQNYTFTVTTNRALVANFASSVPNPAIVFSQPQPPGFGLIPSSYLYPDGIDGDGYAYDNFTLPTTQNISQINWIGGYQGGDAVFDFIISIYTNVYNAPVATYDVGGNANETPVGGYSGYLSYSFTLPNSFHAVAGTTYWVQIEGQQTALPNRWGMAYAAGGDGIFYYKATPGGASPAAGDLAFTLITSAGTNSSTINAVAQPAGGGLIMSGSGTYINGTKATAIVYPSPGYLFAGWSTNGVTMSTNTTASFTVTTNTTLFAIFNPTFAVSLTALPAAGGSVTGAGTYLALTSVNAVAHTNAGYNFVNWTDAGVPVSTATNYNFTVAGTRTLVANFAPIPVPLTLTNSSGTNLSFSWNPATTGWVLQESPDLIAWTNSTRTLTTNGNQRSVTVLPLTGNNFFRLYHP